MAKKKTQPINLFGQKTNDGIIRIGILDFENDKDFLINLILKHRKQSVCKECDWNITLFEGDASKIELPIKECLLSISIEFMLVGKAIEKLRDEYGFNIRIDYNTAEPVMNLIIFVFCEKA